jgi:TPR repeat protein
MKPLNKNEVARLKTLANAGDSDAQLHRGKHYHLGGEAETALQWYAKSAEQGDARAKTNLGIMYKEGLGVPANIESALRLWNEARDSGSPQAAFALGMAYLNGNGVENPRRKRFRFFRRRPITVLQMHNGDSETFIETETTNDVFRCCEQRPRREIGIHSGR